MSKPDKLTKKLIIIGILLAAAVIIAAKLLKLDQKTMLTAIIFVWAVIMVVRMYIINGRNKEYSGMLEQLDKILTDDNDPEKYIRKCNDYILKVDDEAFKEMLKLNSATGYSCMCKYDEAIDVLKSVDLSLLNPGHKIVAMNNLAQYSYLIGDADAGNKYVNDNFDNMRRYVGNKNFAATFMITFAFYYYYKGNKNKADEFCEKVIEFIKNSGSESEGDMYILKKLEELSEKIKLMPDPEELYGKD